MATTIKKREEIEEQFKWKLEDMYETDEAWEKEYDEFFPRCEEIKFYEGKLGSDVNALLGYFEKLDELNYYINRIIVYSNQRYHQDTAVSKYQAYAAKAENAIVAFGSAIAFAAPEILAIPESVIQQFYADEPKLLKYKRALDEQFRSKEHILSPAEEALLAKMSEVTRSASNIYEMFNNADIKFGSIRDVEGNRLPITHGSFISLLENSDRTVRRSAHMLLSGESGSISCKNWDSAAPQKSSSYAATLTTSRVLVA